MNTSIPIASGLPPKYQLQGLTLQSGWTLGEPIFPSPDSTGGNFGVGYKATRGSELAFVKAIDFVQALNHDDPLEALTQMAGLATFEKDVLVYCSERRMSRVLRYLGHEYIYFDGTKNPLSRVSCLVMEAGTTDLRRLVSNVEAATCSWNLHVLSDVAQAISQLHRGGIAHQDVKPSNVIAVTDPKSRAPNPMKLGDVGRVVRRDQSGPYDKEDWPGDPNYCPPERWYGHVPPDWCDARDAADAYMLGSLMSFLFTGTTLQSLVMQQIPEPFRPTNWKGRFDENLMPVLVNAHEIALDTYLRPQLLPNVAETAMRIARALTHPDPLKRGDPNARLEKVGRNHTGSVGIDRIHNKFQLLANQSAAVERGQRLR